ncbi:type IV pilus modification PilV family protein [Mycoavidus cysteinexigens]|nr:hypothetical protein [Mycoavidus cysteinexigens]GAM52571.1 hypothetical protein EBME_1034 [bacterium endosymbiont of Mortierella elongata FMR23-6]
MRSSTAQPLLKRWRRLMQGDSLIEVMVALWLIGFAALGAISLQLSVIRAQQSMIWRTSALSLAEAAAEALRSGYPAARVVTEWRLRAAQLLPSGDIRLLDPAPEIRLIVLSWRRPAQWLGGDYDTALSDSHACPFKVTGAMTQCLALAIAK